MLCVVEKKGLGGGFVESLNFGNSWWGESRVTHSCLSLPRDREGNCEEIAREQLEVIVGPE
jgi:hypothetical protein